MIYINNSGFAKFLGYSLFLYFLLWIYKLICYNIINVFVASTEEEVYEIFLYKS